MGTTSFGTLLKLGDGGGPENYTTIAEVKDISGPSLELGTEDITNHSSTDGWKEFVATLLDAGEVSFDLNFLPGNATQSYSNGLLKDMANKTKRNFQIVFPSSSPVTWGFAAFVTKFEPKEPVEGSLQASATLKITGKPTLA